jgi:DNA-binding CsgD family transcriptional regulator/PAS domain-containing protein
MAGKQAEALISIYNAANDSDGWNNSLDLCVDYVDAYSANILFHDNSEDSRWRYSLGSHRWRACSMEQLAKTIELFEKYDAEAWRFVHQHPKQTLLVDTDYWTEPAQIKDRADYRFFREELGFQRKVGSTLNDNRCWTDNIAFQFPAHLDTVPDLALRKIRTLLPHAAKSIELWRTFSILKSQYKAVLSALDHVQVGLCVADHTGTIIVANEEARRILDLSNAIQLGRNKRLQCQSKALEQSLDNAMASVSATSNGEDSIVESFGVAGNKHDIQIALEVAPLRDSGAEIATRFNGALITLIDLSAELNVDIDKIAGAYRLSPSECAVCKMIVNGASVSTIAESRNVAIDTVKSQLKSSYRKTGCKSRVELARLALKADPPVR